MPTGGDLSPLDLFWRFSRNGYTLSAHSLAYLRQEIFITLAQFRHELLFQQLQLLKPVHAEAAEVFSQFAPGYQCPHIAPEKQGHRPQTALGYLRLFVGVHDRDHLRSTDCAAQLFQRFSSYALIAQAVAWDVEGNRVDAVAERRREDSFDLAQGVVGRRGELGVAPCGYHAAA